MGPKRPGRQAPLVVLIVRARGGLLVGPAMAGPAVHVLCDALLHVLYDVPLHVLCDGARVLYDGAPVLYDAPLHAE
eukprot:2607428-Pyramimonas_sp.AAC.1